MALGNAYAALNSNRFTRKWGTQGNAVDPYISGYFHTKWKDLDNAEILNQINNTYSSSVKLSGFTEVSQILEASCISVTTPGATLNTVEFIGMGGVTWGVPGGADFDNTLSMRFIEFSELPILRIISGWFRSNRDYTTGISNRDYSNTTPAPVRKAEYGSTLYFWTTQPDGRTIETYNCAAGVFPMRDPLDLYSSDIAANDKVEVEIDFHLDYLYREPWVKTVCEGYNPGDPNAIVADYNPTTAS